MQEQRLKGLYYIVTYGCQMNVHESEKIAGILEKQGFAPGESIEDVDLLILNTCCVRDSAEQRIIGHLGTLKKYKVRRPDMRIGVLGCMCQQEGMQERLMHTFPFLDFVLGTQNLTALSEALAGVTVSRTLTAELNDDVEERDQVPMTRRPGPTAYVNIMYGCNNFCSYCIVPHVRGPERSRSVESIIAEIEMLAGAGCQEVTLLGQNVNSYAADGCSFPDLLERIVQECEVMRIRFMTSHPKDLSDRLITLISREPRICSQLHLPLQSGSDRILASMNRGYTSGHYLALLKRLRQQVPEIGLTTDLIVGYPGETERDFQATLAMVDEIRFNSAYTFVYSARKGTRAASMPNQVEKAVKKDRIMRLIERQNAITLEINQAEVGTIQDVLVEGCSARNAAHLTGRTERGITVNFPGSAALIGHILPVQIVEAKKTTLFGKLEDSHICRS